MRGIFWAEQKTALILSLSKIIELLITLNKTKMLKQFTSEYIRQNEGCYEGTNKTTLLLEKTGENPTLLNLLNELPPKDFIWFLRNHCGLTIEEKLEFSIFCAELLIPIYEKAYNGELRYRNSVYLTKALYYQAITIEFFLKDEDCMYAYAYANANANDFKIKVAEYFNLTESLQNQN